MTEVESHSGAKPHLLLVDDDPLIVDTLSFVLGRDFSITTAATRQEAVEKLRAMGEPAALALVDLGLPPLPHRPDEGYALIAELLAHSPEIKIFVLSGQNQEASARHARALGAADFVAKPADPAQLQRMLVRALSFPPARVAEMPLGSLVGESLPIQKIRSQIRQYAASPFPVLIEGESGSGKEVIANCLHEWSKRSSSPYLALNCAAISPTLVEPTLFGYAKGSFTGATGAKSGYFEDSANGTLFLDEIGELPLELQAKLLRVLENGEFQRVGETQTRVSRARVIAATNRDLRKEVKEGRFRGDLYHRVSVFSIVAPPLREMGSDRLLLLDHYRNHYSASTGTPQFMLSAEAQQRWLLYDFPGNVRELRNIVIRLIAKHGADVVDVPTLDAELDTSSEAAPGIPEDEDIRALALRAIQTSTNFNLDETLRNWERAYIEAAHGLTQGNVSQMARLLGIHRTTLYNRIDLMARGRTGAAPEK